MTDVADNLLGVVLCGGQSTRMGRDKAELRLSSGLSFLDHACRRIEAVCPRVCVSANSDRVTNHRLISDVGDSHGPISGINAALALAVTEQLDGCLFTPVDTPNLTVTDLRRLVAVFQRCPTQIVCATKIANTYDLEPLIAIYPTTAHKILADAERRGQFGLQTLLRKLSVRRVELGTNACKNINDPTDFDLLS